MMLRVTRVHTQSVILKVQKAQREITWWWITENYNKCQCGGKQIKIWFCINYYSLLKYSICKWKFHDIRWWDNFPRNRWNIVSCNWKRIKRPKFIFQIYDYRFLSSFDNNYWSTCRLPGTLTIFSNRKGPVYFAR